jgi:hypothetical protein
MEAAKKLQMYFIVLQREDEPTKEQLLPQPQVPTSLFFFTVLLIRVFDIYTCLEQHEF